MNKPVKGGYTDKPAAEDDLNIERYIIDLTMADGTETEITAYNPFLVIDGAGCRSKYAPCEALNSYANWLLRNEGVW